MRGLTISLAPRCPLVLLVLAVIGFSRCTSIAADVPVHSMPFILKNYASVYAQSPRKSALAWFDDARLGMMVCRGVWGKHHAAWAMFKHRIPLEEYQQTAREVDASGFNAREIVKLAESGGMRFGPKPDGSIPEDVTTNFHLLGARIREHGYPALNRTTYLEKRQHGAAVDQSERESTAR